MTNSASAVLAGQKWEIYRCPLHFLLILLHSWRAAGWRHNARRDCSTRQWSANRLKRVSHPYRSRNPPKTGHSCVLLEFKAPWAEQRVRNLLTRWPRSQQPPLPCALPELEPLVPRWPLENAAQRAFAEKPGPFRLVLRVAPLPLRASLKDLFGMLSAPLALDRPSRRSRLCRPTCRPTLRLQLRPARIPPFCRCYLPRRLPRIADWPPPRPPGHRCCLRPRRLRPHPLLRPPAPFPYFHCPYFRIR